MASELFIPPSKALDANANPYSGAKWFFYATGTTTPQTVYTTAALSVAHANPVVADSSGKFANIFFDPALVYRGVLKDSTEAVTLHDIDPVSSGTLAALLASGGSALVGFLQAGTGATARTAQAKMRDFVNVKDFGATGDGVTNDRAAINAAHTAHKKVYYPAGTYLISGGGIELPNGVNGIAMVGDGISTKLTGGNSNGVILINSHDGVYIADMWIETTIAAFGGISTFHTELNNVVVERCKFTTNGAILTNGIKMVMDNSINGLDGMVIRDCVFDTCGRMGVEIQNNNAGDTVARYRNVTIENCKFLRSGEAVGGGSTAGMAVSLTGEGENCEVINNYFDQCTGPSIEIIGASRSIVRGNFIRRAKNRPLQIANSLLMSGNIISENVVYELDATAGGNVFLGSMTNSIIANNTFDMTGKAGAAVELTAAVATGTGKNQFVGNTVRTNAATVLYVDGCPDNTITGNTLDNSANGANTAVIQFNGANSTRNTAFANYVAKGTGGELAANTGGATGNLWSDLYSLESGAVYIRNADAGKNGFAVYDAPSIAAGGVATTTVTVTGCVVTDYAQASLDISPGGLIVSAAVTAANTVTVTFHNPTAGAIDLASTVIRARTTPSQA